MSSVTVISERSKNEFHANQTCFERDSEHTFILAKYQVAKTSQWGASVTSLIFMFRFERPLNIAEFNNTEEFQHVKNSLH